ncbi:hypothetical protein C8Q79DRAFT_667340 [Trametes meyenii]|nr:hypothetical protein C8Q79DRAFT_667340 [Trametes meyenii]
MRGRALPDVDGLNAAGHKHAHPRHVAIVLERSTTEDDIPRIPPQSPHPGSPGPPRAEIYTARDSAANTPPHIQTPPSSPPSAGAICGSRPTPLRPGSIRQPLAFRQVDGPTHTCGLTAMRITVDFGNAPRAHGLITLLAGGISRSTESGCALAGTSPLRGRRSNGSSEARTACPTPSLSARRAQGMFSLHSYPGFTRPLELYGKTI